ncbi:MAG: carbon-nitrogen hydrolase family protein [Oscillospiraceae bacterium]|nr:carbon-nitrogen hydrolase family protein [Oscillospiraceae bacterium]
MKDLKNKCKIAVVQAAPVMFDKAACVDKAVTLAAECARGGAEFIVFPELFVPGYPYGMTFGFSVGRRDESKRRDWLMYYENSIVVPGAETEKLAEAARSAGVWLSIGVSERDAVTATLYNSNLIFAPDGTLAAHHRKLKPTGSERVVWGDADSGFFPVAETPWGGAGCLICWESYMPLARAALYQKGVTLYLAPNTNDYEQWLSTMRHIAVEGRCYVINCDMFFTRGDYPQGLACAEEIAALPDTVCRGGSCIIDPRGEYVTKPLWDSEGIIYADLDMSLVAAGRMEFDPCGHYSRPDVLRLEVRE